MHFSVTIARQLIRERSPTNKSSCCISSSMQLRSKQSQRFARKMEKQIFARYPV
ncbi:hypothetical protein MTR67_045043 [Solanum verrucosum]|uniref:Uncharacterized protein n=1 Tax=Solanum verrucosum TaxID=315347 RepID=A0AAF0UUM1_SOLVR|nr:hypothetical protein MTR67_045043 [Solanum verrucosum]